MPHLGINVASDECRPDVTSRSTHGRHHAEMELHHLQHRGLYYTYPAIQGGQPDYFELKTGAS
jgi:hypothetical protein